MERCGKKTGFLRFKEQQGNEQVKAADRDNTLKKFSWEERWYSIQGGIFKKKETDTYLCTKRKNQ